MQRCGKYISLSENLSALDSADPFDVCIIGSGFAGTVLGKCLVERGVRTVILESGSSLFRWVRDSRLKRLAAYQFSGNTDYPLVRTRARARGGTSNFWTGRCERLHPSDFERNPYTPSLNPWPITYAEIEPYYERAENSLRVRGGRLSAYAPPRKKGFPVSATSNISGLKSLMAEAGVTVEESPTATPSKALRFFRVQKEILPGFLASPHGVFVSGATVTRLVPDTDRRIMGAEARALEGDAKIARARIYVVACGGIETPRLLLVSRSEVFPEGIGNTHDRVGRCFNEHAGVNFYGKIRHRRSTIYPRHKIGRSHQFYEQYRREGLGSVLPVFIQSWIFPHHLLRYKLLDIPKNAMSILGRIIRPTLYIGATIEMYPSDSNRVTLDENVRDCFGNPLPHLKFSYVDKDVSLLDRTRKLILKIYDRLGARDVYEADVTWSRHHISTCRMGDDPKTSVVDRNLRVHESTNLYLCGSEVFVTGSAAPPVLTITALAHRLADHLVARLRQAT
jgi:choline dehydrogenase-like flavoprotein